MFGKSKRKVGDIIEPFEEKRSAELEMLARITERPQVASSGPPAAPEANSSISAGLSIVGKIVGQGKLSILGHVEGEVHASTVQIGDGAQVEGNIVAEELTIGGRVKGTIHANRVKLTSTAVVQGDIYHRSLAIEEMSRRQVNIIDTPSRVPANLPQAQAVSIDGSRKGKGASDLAASAEGPI